MKNTITILLWCACALSISGQNQQIYYSDSTSNTNPSVNIRGQINTGTSTYDKQIESFFTDGVTRLTLNINRLNLNNPQQAYDDAAYGPLTIAGALALVMMASVGQTAYEIANVMGLTQSQTYFDNPLAVHGPISRLLDRIDTNEILSPNEIVSYATAIFVQQDFPIRQEFLKAINETYKSEIRSVNFKKRSVRAQEEINNWVSQHTRAKIPKLFNAPPPPQTTAIIASVLYFKAAWEQPFFEGYTKPKPFYINGRNQPSDRMLDMMANGGDFPYFKDRNLNVEIMGFPYKGKRITMYVLLPNDSNQQTLRNLEGHLTPEDIHRLVNSTRVTEAAITFPKLKIESSYELKGILSELKVRDLFDPRQSNLALMSGMNNVVQNPPTASQNPSLGGQNILYTNPTAAPSQLGIAPTRYSQTPPSGMQYQTSNIEKQTINQQQSSQLQASVNYRIDNAQRAENYPTQISFGGTNYASFDTPNGPNPSNFYPQNPSTWTQTTYPPAKQQINYQNNLGIQNSLQQTFNNVGAQYNPGAYTTHNLPQNLNNNAQNGYVNNQNQGGVYNSPQYSTTTPYSIASPTRIPLQEGLIFSKAASGCQTDVYNITRCDSVNQAEHMVTSQFSSQSHKTNPLDDLNEIRQRPNLHNPGIYADQIVHKVYIEITESGTEAAAATGISLNRSGGRVLFRLDVPFLFFIYHEESKVILFWGSVKNPTPSRSP